MTNENVFFYSKIFFLTIPSTICDFLANVCVPWAKTNKVREEEGEGGREDEGRGKRKKAKMTRKLSLESGLTLKKKYE